MTHKDNNYEHGEKDRKVPVVSEASAVYRVGGFGSMSQDDVYKAEAESVYAEIETVMDRILSRTSDIKSDINSIRSEIAASGARG